MGMGILLTIAIFIYTAAPGFAMTLQEAKVLLNLQGNPNPSEKEIKAAYRKQSQRFHPDSPSPERSKEQFIEVKNAYDYLRHKAGPITEAELRADPTFRRLGRFFTWAVVEDRFSRENLDQMKNWVQLVDTEIQKLLRTQYPSQGKNQIAEYASIERVLTAHEGIFRAAKDSHVNVDLLFWSVISELKTKNPGLADSLSAAFFEKVLLAKESNRLIGSIQAAGIFSTYDYDALAKMPKTVNTLFQPQLTKILDENIRHELFRDLANSKMIDKHPDFFKTQAKKGILPWRTILDGLSRQYRTVMNGKQGKVDPAHLSLLTEAARNSPSQDRWTLLMHLLSKDQALLNSSNELSGILRNIDVSSVRMDFWELSKMANNSPQERKEIYKIFRAMERRSAGSLAAKMAHERKLFVTEEYAKGRDKFAEQFVNAYDTAVHELIEDFKGIPTSKPKYAVKPASECKRRFQRLLRPAAR